MTSEQAFHLLQKLGIHGYVDHGAGSGSDGNGGDNVTISNLDNGNCPGHADGEQLRSAHQNSRDDERVSLPFDGYSSASFAGQSVQNSSAMEPRQNRLQTLSSFSPFSPDPNLYTAMDQRRKPVPFLRAEQLPHPSKSYAPGFGPSPLHTQNLKPADGSCSRVSPTSTRPPSASRYGPFLDNSAPSFQMIRGASRPEAPISRPSSGQTSTPGRGMEYERQEHDLIQDLNGTLASLDLDNGPGQGPWKLRTDSSGGPTMFRINMNTQGTPSP